MDEDGGAELRERVVLDLLPPRAGQDADHVAGPGALSGQEVLVQLLFVQSIEVRVADVGGVNAARLIPGPLERQGAQDAIDIAAHLPHAPAGPAPDLRR